MNEHDDDNSLAPKIFFLAPDPSLVTETFLETAFLMGFETYALPDQLGADLHWKVEVLVETFPELILFFTVDRKGTPLGWARYLAELQQRHSDHIRIGVMYTRTSDPALDLAWKTAFLFEAGLTAGCLALYPSARKNHEFLLNVLEANQAAGRRKRIRMRCHAESGVNFLRDQGSFAGTLVDLSTSHFSVRFDSGDPGWDIGTKIAKIQLRLDGRLLMVNALVALCRRERDHTVYVFLFHSAGPGLDDRMKAEVNNLIYRRFRARVEVLIEERMHLAV